MSRWSVRRDVYSVGLSHQLEWDGVAVVTISTLRADEFDRLIALDAAPLDLPEGVHAAPDGTLLCRGKDVPGGPWERKLIGADDFGWTSCEHDDTGMVDGPFQDRWYEVRRVPVLEQVPVDLALIGRKLPGGETITRFTACSEHGAAGGVYVEVMLDDNVWANPERDADGRVSVLPLDGGES